MINSLINSLRLIIMNLYFNMSRLLLKFTSETNYLSELTVRMVY